MKREKRFYWAIIKAQRRERERERERKGLFSFFLSTELTLCLGQLPMTVNCSEDLRGENTRPDYTSNRCCHWEKERRGANWNLLRHTL
jgi:hypothetical protein